MKVTLIQNNLLWHDPQGNLQNFENLIDGIDEPTDLIVLPEMFSTGFTMEPEKHSQEAGGSWLAWIKNMAGKKNSAITGSLAVNDHGKYYNRMYFVEPDGIVQFYNKRHLFRMGGEHEHYSPGSERKIIDYKDLRICLQVCYDLRFPVWSRNRYLEKDNRYEYDVLIYVANWPAARSYAWKQLLIARAIENQSYVIGVNRVGSDGNGVAHRGDSAIIGPKGEELLSAPKNKETVVTLQIDRTVLDQFRKQFPAGLDADSFTIHTEL